MEGPAPAHGDVDRDDRYAGLFRHDNQSRFHNAPRPTGTVQNVNGDGMILQIVHQGIGTELLSYLTDFAKREGLLGFTAEVLIKK
jgi:hypothetical protein